LLPADIVVGGGLRLSHREREALKDSINDMFSAPCDFACPAELRLITDAAHPVVAAAGGAPVRGVFATAPLRRGQLVHVYASETLTDAEAEARDGGGSLYLSEFSTLNSAIVVDASRRGNLTRDVNDPRGSGRPANVQLCEVWDNTTGHPYIVVIAASEIPAGGELLLS